jgi:transcriptional regulator with XRE-family HTH domain
MSETKMDHLIEKVRTRRRLPPPEVRRMIRQQAGISLRELAQAIGVTQPTITRWELGLRSPERGPYFNAYLNVLDRLVDEVAKASRDA